MWRTSSGICISILFAFVACALPAHAQDAGGFRFDSFDEDITVNADSSLDVVEHIRGEFLEPRHGLFRSIPVQYTNPNGTTFSIAISVDGVMYNGQDATYDAYRDGPFETIKIGDADVTVQGPFAYDISYHVERAILYHDTQDELYWNVTGDQWGAAIPSTAAVVHLPTTASDTLAVTCYTGPYGSTEQNCTSRVEGGQAVVEAQDFLTVSVLFPKGLVHEPTPLERNVQWIADNWDFGFFAVPLLALILLVFRWYARGRDPKGRGTIMAEYEPVDNLRPTEIGTLVDGNLEPHDFSAAIVDLAVRGYLHIVETESGVLMFKKKSYTLKKMKEPDAALKPFETEIMNGFFAGETEIALDAKKSALVATKKKVEKMVYKDMAAMGYFAADPSVVRAAYIGGAIVVGFVGYFIGSAVMGITDRPVAILAFVLTAIIIAFFSGVMPKWTEKGVLAMEHAKGFKLYLETAEKYRVEWQEKENIFEKFLPYAMAFQVADKWAKVFADVQKEQPSWYEGGNMAAFNAVAFSNHVSSFGTTAARVATPQSSGGGSGGSSGGGFGGGGGGSW